MANLDTKIKLYVNKEVDFRTEVKLKMMVMVLTSRNGI
jgi:hypothetical protein